MSNAFVNVQRMLDSIYAGAKQGDDLTFSAWRGRTKATRDCLVEMKETVGNIIDNMRQIYAESYIAERKASYEQDIQEWTAAARKMAYDDLAGVIAAKREAYNKANSAPTQEQINLLTVLNMRTSVDALEIANASAHVADNLPALRLLSEIAHRNNLPFPALYDDFDEDIAEIEEYGKTLIQLEIDKPTGDLGYLSRLFWTTENSGQMQPLFDKLDHLSYISQNAPDPVVPEASENAEDGKKAASESDKWPMPEGPSNPTLHEFIMNGAE